MAACCQSLDALGYLKSECSALIRPFAVCLWQKEMDEPWLVMDLHFQPDVLLQNTILLPPTPSTLTFELLTPERFDASIVVSGNKV